MAIGDPVTITVHPDQPLHKVSKDLFGIFFEEINCAGDGGIYPELVRNRSFDDSDKPEHWEVSPGLNSEVVKGKLNVNATQDGEITNNGYWGMNLEKGQKYSLQVTGDFQANSKLTLQATDGSKPIAEKTLNLAAGMGRTVLTTISPTESTMTGALVLKVAKGQKFSLDYVSLFPVNTFKGRKNGLRPGLMGMLTDMHPAFVRFPGGCWVEGDRMASAYRWKTTINDLETRRTVPNLWGYKSTNGLGYHEYLQMCEDLGSAPLFVVNCGMSHKETIPLNKMDEYVQDAIDAVEYANGPVTSKWGAVRASNGHPKSFNLKYMEIGNENGGPAYKERYKLIYNAIKAKYPEIKTIADVWGGTPTGTPIETIDEHYYSDPSFFFRNANRYDSYDRKGPKVYVGEYAVTQGAGSGNHIAAIAEAAFMTGMERNSDHVVMASYAPLFANVNAKAWNPDLIYFDSNKVYGTPSYYVQKMFAQNRSSVIVKSSMSGVPESITPFPAGGVGVGTWGTKAEYKDVSITEKGQTKQISAPQTQMKQVSGSWEFDGNSIRQTSMDDGTRCVFPSPTSSTYTLKLKAKKISGREGFLITVGYKDEDNYLWLNLGGWGNSQHGLEYAVSGGKSQVGRQIDGTIETGRWYDVQIDYSPNHIVCKLDGKTLFDQKPSSTPHFFYTTGIDNAKNELIVKVVQGSDTFQDVVVDLAGARTADTASGLVLSSEDVHAENSLETPKKISPVAVQAKVAGGKLAFTAKPYSLTVFRIPLK
jgi:alpha-L-arabinofuranosidase